MQNKSIFEDPEFWIRSTLTLGQGVYELINAIKSGDTNTTQELSKRLDSSDKILADGEADKQKVRREKGLL